MESISIKETFEEIEMQVDYKCLFNRMFNSIVDRGRISPQSFEEFLNFTLNIEPFSHCQWVKSYAKNEFKFYIIEHPQNPKTENIFEFFTAPALILEDGTCYEFNYITRSYTLREKSEETLILLENARMTKERYSIASQNNNYVESPSANYGSSPHWMNWIIWDYPKSLTKTWTILDHPFSKAKRDEDKLKWINKQINGWCNLYSKEQRDFMMAWTMLYIGESDNILRDVYARKCVIDVDGRTAVWSLDGKFVFID